MAAPMMPAISPSRTYREWEAMEILLSGRGRPTCPYPYHHRAAQASCPTGHIGFAMLRPRSPAALSRTARSGDREDLEDVAAQELDPPATDAVDLLELAQVPRGVPGQPVDQALGEEHSGIEPELAGSRVAPGTERIRAAPRDGRNLGPRGRAARRQVALGNRFTVDDGGQDRRPHPLDHAGRTAGHRRDLVEASRALDR